MALWKRNTITDHTKQKGKQKSRFLGFWGQIWSQSPNDLRTPKIEKTYNWTDKYVLKAIVTFLEAKYGSEQVYLKTNYKY